jgi:hypothetical protein
LFLNREASSDFDDMNGLNYGGWGTASLTRSFQNKDNNSESGRDEVPEEEILTEVKIIAMNYLFSDV